MRTLKPLSLFEPDFPTMLKGGLMPMWMNTEPATPAIKVDGAEKDDGYLVQADVPGVVSEDIQVDAGADRYFVDEHNRRWVGAQGNVDANDFRAAGLNPADYQEGQIRR